jgi:hypothetical protein
MGRRKLKKYPLDAWFYPPDKPKPEVEAYLDLPKRKRRRKPRREPEPVHPGRYGHNP